MRSTFTFNGHSSDEYDIYIENRHNLSRSARKFQTASVNGRNGNIYQLQNAWEEVYVSYDIYAGGADKGDDEEAFTDIMEWLNSADGYAKLTDSYDTGHYRLAVFVDATDVEAQWLALGRATITFRCRPERFLVTTPLTPASGGTITNSTNHVAEPIITLTGSGARSMLNLNGRSLRTLTPISNESQLYKYISNKNTSYYNVWAYKDIAYGVERIFIQGSDTTYVTVNSISNTNSVIEFQVHDIMPEMNYGVGILIDAQGDADYTLTCEAYEFGRIDILFGNKSGYSEITKWMTFETPQQFLNTWISLGGTFHTPSDCGYVMLIFAHNPDGSPDSSQKFRKIMLNNGTNALAYREYNASPSSSLTLNNTTLSFGGCFNSAQVDCEKEGLTIDGVNGNPSATVKDQYGNLSEEYLNLKKGNNSIAFSGEISAVSIDPRYWEL